MDEIAGHCAELQSQNNRDSKGVELLFGEKREKEQQGSGLEQQIRKQREATNSLLQVGVVTLGFARGLAESVCGFYWVLLSET